MFEIRPTERGFEVSMSAELTNIDLADRRMAEFLDRAGAPLDRFAVRILLREALLNAVTHGSGQDPGMTVRLTMFLDDDGMVMEVEDQGPGFIWQNRDMVFDVCGDGGRGLPIMQIYSSEMTYNDAGNRLVIRRRYESGCACARATGRGD